MNIITELFEELKTRIELINKKLDEQQKGKSDQELSIQPIDFLDDRVVDVMVKLTPKVDLLDLKEMIKNLETQNYKIQKTITTNIEEIKTIIKENTHQNHHHSFEFKSPKIVITFIVLFLMFIVSFTGNIIQHNENEKLENNDIKYRLVKVIHGISSANLDELENIFDNPLSKEKQEQVYKKVIDYETKVRKRSEEIEQARQKEEKARILLKESEQIRKEK